MSSINVVSLMMALGAVSLVAFLVCVYVVRAERALAEHRVATDVGTRIGRHGLWVGAWLVAIPAGRAQRVRDEARSEAGKRAPPERILELWRSAGAELLTHLPGPEVTTEAEACGWLEHASSELSEVPVSPLAAGDRRSVFALVYACTEPPPARAVGWAELRDRLLGPACVGAAFVSCMEGVHSGADHRVPLRAIGLAKWAFLAASIAGLTYWGAALALSDVRVVATPVDAGAPGDAGRASRFNAGVAGSNESANGSSGTIAGPNGVGAGPGGAIGGSNGAAAASGAAAAPGATNAGTAADAAASAANAGADAPNAGTAAGAVPTTTLILEPPATAPGAAASPTAIPGVPPVPLKPGPGVVKPKTTAPAGAGVPGNHPPQTPPGSGHVEPSHL